MFFSSSSNCCMTSVKKKLNFYLFKTNSENQTIKIENFLYISEEEGERQKEEDDKEQLQ